MLNAAWKKNDKKAKWLIFTFSAIVFAAVVALGRVKLDVQVGFDVHIFAAINAVINSMVAVLLLAALVAVKSRKYQLHKQLILAAMVLSILFLVSYICHHLLAGETRFGDVNHDGLVDEMEKAAVSDSRMIYYIILGTILFSVPISLWRVSSFRLFYFLPTGH